MGLLRRLCLTLALLCTGLLPCAVAYAECGGTTQCIAIGLTSADALNAHHGGAPPATPTVAFGNQTIGTASASQTIHVAAVTGPGGTMAALAAITISGANAAEYTITGGTCSPTNGPVHGGAECTITVAFSPASLGAKTATLNVPLTAPSCVGCITGRTATLTGTGAAAAPAAGATSLSVQADTPTSVDLAPFISGTALLGIRIVTVPLNGTAAVSGTRVTYTPARGYLGADTFTYQSFNATTSSPAAAVTVSVVSRADPARDPRVTGLVLSQAQTARRFSRAQVLNFQQRMDSLRSVPIAALPQPGGLRPVAGSAAQPALLAGAAPGGSTASFLTGLFNVASTGALNLSYSSDRSGSPLALPEGVGVWIGGNIRFGTRDLSSDSAGLRFDSEGISFGVDRRFSDALLLGLGMGYGRGTTDIGDDGSKNAASGRSVVLYGSYRLTRNAFLEGSLGYGVMDLDSQRFVPAANDFARANRKGDQLFGSVAAGYEWRGEGVLLSPYGRLDFSSDRLKQATESGGGLAALTYYEQRLSSQQLALGLRAESQHRTRFGWALPRLRVESRHELSGDRGATVGYADQAGGPTYTVAPADNRRSSMAVGLGSDFLMSGGLKLGVEYQVERVSAAERSHALRFLLSKSLDGRTETRGLTEARLFGRPLDVEASYVWDDNITRARDPVDRLSDQAYSLNVSQRAVFPGTGRTRILLSGFVNAEKFRNYDGLDRISGGGQGEWQYRESGGFSAATWGVFVRAALDDYHAEGRSGARAAFGATYRQSLTDRVAVFAAAARNLRSARSPVFDTRDYSLRVNFDYALGAAGNLYAGAEYRRGDAISTGNPAVQNVVIARYASPDDAFGGQRIAYRYDAETILWTLGYSRPLGPRDSVDFSWRQANSSPLLRGTFAGPGGIYGAAGAPVTVGRSRYTANLLSFSWLTRF